jgi:hypothetical protein
MLLLLVFSQKMGVGLLLHNLFHTTSSIEANRTQNDTNPGESGSGEINYACACIDDFLMPFSEPDKPVVVAIFSNLTSVNEYENSLVPRLPHSHFLLRGPPVQFCN